METSILVARLFAVVYILVGIGMMFNSEYYEKIMDEMFKSKVSVYFGGIMAAVAGALIILYHNTWEANWTTVITVLGYLALLKGALLLMFLKQMLFWRPMIKGYLVQVGIFAVALGIFFAYMGCYG